MASDNEIPTKQQPSGLTSPTTDTQENIDPFYGLSFKVGVAENKNTTYRNKMEDVHTYIANLAEQIDWGYFAIFDGHAGKDTARWCGNNLHSLLQDEISTHSLKGDMQENLYQSFIKADEMIEKEGAGSSGCTAAVAVLRWEEQAEEQEQNIEPNTEEEQEPVPGPVASASADAADAPTKFDFIPGKNHKRMLYTSNVGDSRIVLCRLGKPYRLSYDHKATDLYEINRIREAGGLVLKNRVNGVLAVTRSLGDSYMKDLVIGKPFTTSTQITHDDEFMILGCDGLWDVVSDSKACKLVRELFLQGNDPKLVAKKLCQLAMDNSTTDNVTVMIVKFDNQVFN
ncbi:Protein phosphatase 2C 1 [Spathaspora sp. JA1]|nr:Protein phosphatase 2C 1 [Spathaspora sp. JA1]